MTSSKLNQAYDLNWEEIVEECDYNGDGVIDFQEFISACIDKSVLTNTQEVAKAFKILDTNGDGYISLEDFDDLFSAYGGTKIDTEMWDGLLMEADKNEDGRVSFDEFQEAMSNLLRKNIKKKRRNTTKR